MKRRTRRTGVVALTAVGAWIAGGTAPADTGRPEEDDTMVIEVRSEAFDSGSAIPKKYTGEGEDVSPPLSWSGVPEGAKELALICDDPDAPTPEPWVHWVAYKIPADVTKLDENASGDWLEGKNDFGNQGYGGPMPPPGHGVHNYHFKLYALDMKLDAKEGLTKNELLDAMKGHVVAEGELVGTYERK